MTPHYARSVPGSAQLKTCQLGADPVLEELEELAPGQLESRHRGQQVLGKAVVRSGFIPVLAEVFDQLCALLSPIEALLYLQLYRYSYGEERNYCQKSRRDLCQVCSFSERRFNRALAGLVAKKLVELLHRDKGGTFYLVHLPRQTTTASRINNVIFGRLPKAARSGHSVHAQTSERSSQTSEHALQISEQACQRTKVNSINLGSPTSMQQDSMALDVGTPDSVSDSSRNLASPRPKPARATLASNRGHKVRPIDENLSLGSIVELLLATGPARRRQAQALDVLQDLTDLLEDGISLIELNEMVLLFARRGHKKAEQFVDFVKKNRQDSA